MVAIGEVKHRLDDVLIPGQPLVHKLYAARVAGHGTRRLLRSGRRAGTYSGN